MAWHSPDVPGFNAYSIIGAGPSGAVYTARNASTGKTAAIKLFTVNAFEPDVFDDLVATAKRMSWHKNIVSVQFGGITGDGRPFVVMDLLDRQSLAQRPPLTPRAAVDVGGKLASALEFLHHRGYVHGNIAPSTVLFTQTGEPMLNLGPHSVHGALPGAAFTAPEVAAGKAATAESDTYAIAATVAFALGRRDGAAQPASIPAGVAAVLDRAMAPDPALRQASTADFGAELARAANTRQAVAAVPAGVAPAVAVAAAAIPAAVVAAGASASGSPAGAVAPQETEPHHRRVVPGGRFALVGVAAAFIAVGTIGWAVTEHGGGSSSSEVQAGAPAASITPAVLSPLQPAAVPSPAVSAAASSVVVAPIAPVATAPVDTAPVTTSPAAPAPASSGAASTNAPIMVGTPASGAQSASGAPSDSAKAHAPTYVRYTVKAGDNLFVIAQWFHQQGFTPVYQWNQTVIGKDPNLIKPGQQLIVAVQA